MKVFLLLSLQKKSYCFNEIIIIPKLLNLFKMAAEFSQTNNFYLSAR